MASPPSLSLSAAPWLELFDSPHGLGLRVIRNAPAGTALLTERPLAAVTGIRSRECRPRPRRCRRCLSLLSLRPPSRLRTCSGCGGASSYCDSDCEDEDRGAHSLSGECDLLRRVQEKEGEEEAKKTPLLREACLALRLLRARPPSAGPLVAHADELLGADDRGRQVRAAAELAAAALEAAAAAAAAATAGAPGPTGGDGDRKSVV